MEVDKVVGGARQVVVDTETTGLDFARDRVVEIGAVELENLRPTGRTFHAYHNPGMPMPAEATAVHGITDEFLADQPPFDAAQLMAFIGDATLVAHNASFDVGMLNAELARCGLPPLSNPVVDTLAMARAKHPGASASLDALCKRYGISTAHRTKHGALLDAELLAAVYVDLVGRQRALDLVEIEAPIGEYIVLPRPRALEPRLSESELAAHAAMVATMGNSLWGVA